MKFQIFDEKSWFCWNSVRANLAHGSDFRRVWDLKIAGGPALRAMFIITSFTTCTSYVVRSTLSLELLSSWPKGWFRGGYQDLVVSARFHNFDDVNASEVQISNNGPAVRGIIDPQFQYQLPLWTFNIGLKRLKFKPSDENFEEFRCMHWHIILLHYITFNFWKFMDFCFWERFPDDFRPQIAGGPAARNVHYYIVHHVHNLCGAKHSLSGIALQLALRVTHGWLPKFGPNRVFFAFLTKQKRLNHKKRAWSR